jgi:phosphopentomutase
MEKFRRIFLLVVDSFGIGAMPDAARFGDAGADTFGHILDVTGPLKIPNLQKLGLLNLHPSPVMPGVEEPEGLFAELLESGNTKDTMGGHWEMMGLRTEHPFRTFTETGFPEELIRELERRCGKKVIGNKAASGTEILEELGEQQIRTDSMIVYTSADSVLQIAGNEQIFGLDNLYRCCEIARELTMRDDWKVGRVIARPYVGEKRGSFVRTANRRDYAVRPFGPTVMDALKEAGLDVIAVGKIHDIFSGQGITEWMHSDSSVHGMQQTKELAERDFRGLCFVNLVDFDALWGHRRNPAGYGAELEKFDEALGRLMQKLRPEDLLMITADHGNDPTYRGTDHTRERVPLLVWSPGKFRTGRMETQDSFSVIGATIAENFSVPMPEGTQGDSLLKKIRPV